MCSFIKVWWRRGRSSLKKCLLTFIWDFTSLSLYKNCIVFCVFPVTTSSSLIGETCGTTFRARGAAARACGAGGGLACLLRATRSGQRCGSGRFVDLGWRVLWLWLGDGLFWLWHCNRLLAQRYPLLSRRNKFRVRSPKHERFGASIEADMLPAR